MAERPTSERDGKRDGEQDLLGGDIVERHLARAWRGVAPASDLSQRVRTRLTSSTAATAGAVGLGIASNVHPESAWASVQATGKLGVLLGAGLLGAGLLAGYFIRDARQESSAPVSIETASAPSAVSAVSAPAEPRAPLDPAPLDVESTATPAAAAAPVAPRAHPSRAARARATEREQTPTPSNPARSNGAAPHPGDELALLRRAEHAVRADDSALALALIGELEARYPGSRLLEERRALELMAYCGAGSTDARARAERFLREHPESVYAGRIREACPIEGDRSSRAPR